MEPYDIKKILVPIDFSETSLNALDTAVAISDSEEGGEVTLIHVVDLSDAAKSSTSSLCGINESADEALKILSHKMLVNHGVVIKHVLLRGMPASEICSYAMQIKSDLIVMGARTSVVPQSLLESNVYNVIANAPCPVMTIPSTNNWKDFRKILFPIRLVPNSLDKYDVVRTIIKKNGSSLLLVGLVDQNNEANLLEMKALTEYVKLMMEKDDVICGCEVHCSNSIAHQVLEISDREKPDLIVITADSDETFPEFILGAYTQEIIDHSHFPVLSIRPDISCNFIGLLSKSVAQAFDELYQE